MGRNATDNVYQYFDFLMKKSPLQPKHFLRAFSLIELSIVVLIIGILIAGVTQGSRIVMQARLKVAQNQTQASSVNSVPGLYLWLEPTTAGNIVSATNGAAPENNDSISSWNDYGTQIANKMTIKQLTSANQPKYISNGINGLPSVQFDGANYYLNGTNGIIFSDITIFIVTQLNSILNDLSAFIYSQGPWQANNLQLLMHNTTGYVQYSIYPTSNDFWNTSRSLFDLRPHLLTFRDNNTTKLDIFVDGGYEMSTTSSQSPKDWTSISIGAWNNSGASRYLNGYISEIIIYNRALKNSEVTDVNNYLITKYNIKTN